VLAGSFSLAGVFGVDAWQRAASGESVREEHLTFVDFKQMLGTLSDERLRLLKEVRGKMLYRCVNSPNGCIATTRTFTMMWRGSRQPGSWSAIRAA
jgi:hypothetical protein